MNWNTQPSPSVIINVEEETTRQDDVRQKTSPSADEYNQQLCTKEKNISATPKNIQELTDELNMIKYSRICKVYGC